MPYLPPEDFASILDERDRLRQERDALAAALETLLIEVEPVRFKAVQDIDRQMEDTRKWAERANAARASGSEQWCFLAEFRERAEREIEPFRAAIAEANRVLDRIKGTRI